MWRSATVYAYDAMDRVVVNVKVTENDGVTMTTHAAVLRHTATLAGAGEPDVRQWLVDALVGLLEDI